jgi:hypothetical protein
MTTMRRWVATAAVAAMAAAVPLFAFQEKPQEKKEEPKKESRTAYVRRIFQKDRCSFGDVCRIVLSLAKGEHTDAPFSEVQKDLAQRGILAGDWGLEEPVAVTKGTLAYMLCQALGIKGGVVTRICGMSRRYAFRECVYTGLLRGKTDMEYVTGRELIDALAEAETYQLAGNLDSERK